MAEIITDYEKLCDRADEIDTTKQSKEMRSIITELKHTVKENNLLGLAANQIGYNKRIIVINYSGDIRSYVNPVLYNAKGLTVSRENSPSIPGKEYLVVRNQEVTVTYVTPLGKIKTEKFLGVAATMVQHLVNILDGVLISDIGFEIDSNWDSFTEEEKNELLDMYLESIDLKRKAVQEEIDSNPELKQIDDGIKFLTAIQNGEVKLTPATIHIDNADEINAQLEKERKDKQDNAD